MWREVDKQLKEGKQAWERTIQILNDKQSEKNILRLVRLFVAEQLATNDPD